MLTVHVAQPQGLAGCREAVGVAEGEQDAVRSAGIRGSLGIEGTIREHGIDFRVVFSPFLSSSAILIAMCGRYVSHLAPDAARALFVTAGR